MPGTGFEDTPLVSGTVDAVLVRLTGQVNFDAREIGVKTTEYVEDVISDGIRELGVH